MFRMTALFVVERNKAQLVSELFKMLKLSSQAATQARTPTATSRKALQQQKLKTLQTAAGAEDDPEDQPEIPKFNPMLMKQRGGEARSAHTQGTQALGSLQHASSSGAFSDDEGMSNFEAPSAVPDSKLRSAVSPSTHGSRPVSALPYSATLYQSSACLAKHVQT